jgi:peroxiredoxin
MKYFGCFLITTFLLFMVACTGKSTKANQDVTQNSSESVESGSEGEERGYIVNVGDIAPDFTFTTTSGESLKLSDFRSRIVMLQFTESWCVVCRREMPFIERDIWQKHKDNADFALFGIDRDEPVETVKDFAKQTGITYPLALDPGADIFALYAERSAGITRNVIIDREGRIVMLTRLYDEEEFAAMCAKIDELLK